MNKLFTIGIYLFYGYLVLSLIGMLPCRLKAQTRSDAPTALKNAERAWQDFTEGREAQDPQSYQEAAQTITSLLKEVDEFNPNETKLWQAKSTLLKAYSLWLKDIFQHQWIVPLSEKKEIYQKLLTELEAQTDIKVLRSQNLLMQSAIYYALKDLIKAEKLCKEALLIDSKNPYLLQRLGKIYTQQKKYSEAEKYINQSLALDPSNIETMGELSYIYLLTAREEEALSLINKALLIDPDYFRNLSVLAIILADKGQTEESQQLYAKIRTLQPYYTFAYTNDVSNYIKQKKYPEAIQILETLLQKNPYVSKAWSLMGDVCSYQDKAEDATKNYEKCNAIDNSCLTDIGYQYYKKNEYKTALNYYQQAIAQDSTDKYAYHWAGWCYLLINEYKKAALHFEKAILLDKQYAYAYNGLAMSYEVSDNYPESILNYEKAIEANTYTNNNSQVRIGIVCVSYANLLLEENKHIEAIKYLQIGGKYQKHCQALATAISYEKGIGLPQSYTLAYQQYRQAAQRHPYTSQASNCIVALYENQKIAMDSLDYKVWKAIQAEKALKLTIPAQKKDGQQENVNVFLYDAYPAEVQPLTWESERLLVEKGVVIPEDVSQSLTKLYELAKKNNVSYTKLTKYALEMASE